MVVSTFLRKKAPSIQKQFEMAGAILGRKNWSKQFSIAEFNPYRQIKRMEGKRYFVNRIISFELPEIDRKKWDPNSTKIVTSMRKIARRKLTL